MERSSEGEDALDAVVHFRMEEVSFTNVFGSHWRFSFLSGANVASRVSAQCLQVLFISYCYG